MGEDWRGSKGARCGMNAYKQEECKKTNNGVKKKKTSKYKLRQTVVFTRTKIHVRKEQKATQKNISNTKRKGEQKQ